MRMYNVPAAAVNSTYWGLRVPPHQCVKRTLHWKHSSLGDERLCLSSFQQKLLFYTVQPWVCLQSVGTLSRIWGFIQCYQLLHSQNKLAIPRNVAPKETVLKTLQTFHVYWMYCSNYYVSEAATVNGGTMGRGFSSLTFLFDFKFLLRNSEYLK